MSLLSNNDPTKSEKSSNSTNDIPTIVIRPTRGLKLLDLREVWRYRELAYFLINRDLKVRYNQTIIGAAWAILQPLAMMVIFTLFFGKLAKIPSEGVPYPIFSYTALLPWQLFSRIISESSSSILSEARLVTKVYFPRIIIPISKAIIALVDFAISFIILFILMLIYGISPGIKIIFAPLFIILLLMTSLGISFWFSTLILKYRDLSHVLPFLIQFWLFITPVIYPTRIIPEKWHILYALNPMTGIIEGFRWTLLGTGKGLTPMITVSVIIAVSLFISGIIWFKQKEGTFADMIGA